ncbi:MAG TPA: mechanosensitive ion channel domain-containing protein [Steroidobacteraceae bacterium]|nr:mechanosensitive ion channel domain-containing protein [Steroidobacteraceae bacterium]
MSLLLKIFAVLLLVLLLLTGYGLWATRPPASSTPVGALSATQAEVAGSLPTIEESTLLTAQRLARLATTPEEVPLAHTAVQLADHELDLAFAGALRHLEAHPPVLSPEALEIQDRLTRAQRQLASESERVKRLTDALGKAADADKPPIQDQLDLAQAQQQLDQDEVTEANDDLMRAGGNEHQRVQMMQQEHEAAAQSRQAAPAPAASPLGSLKGLVGKVRQWMALHRKERWLGQAQAHAVESAAQLEAGRQQIATDLAARKEQAGAVSTATPPEAAVPTSSMMRATAGAQATGTIARPPSTSGAPPAASGSALAARTREIAAEQSRLTLRGQRITARKRLAETYGQWSAVVGIQANALLHSALADVAVVLGALVLLLFIDRWLETLLGRAPVDRRQIATLRSVVGVSCQLVGIVVILLVLIGLPGQLGTMIGLAGAGLTVALKDFIIGFLGWFVLMGKHGMRVGDWVEINGVSGEVVELGIFHTVLLETGNWADAGHPTGRRVTFTNAFAIEGHYFNFSTTGQWLWDELLVMVPFDRDARAIADAIQKEVTEATAESSREAEAEWQRAARGRKLGFTAQPGIAIRPAPGGGGVEIAVRYVTRAAERFALRSRLYQSAVQLLSQPKPAA